jgi:hypothetical protein
MRHVCPKSMIGAAIVILIGSAGRLHPAAHSPRYQPLLQGAEVPPDVDQIFSRACQDCHSNKTEWPWYAHIPPMSMLIAEDVRRGRDFLNLSEWASYSKGRKLGYLVAMSSAAVEGVMPPRRYTIIHGDARLSEDDRRKIGAWATEEAVRLHHATPR